MEENVPLLMKVTHDLYNLHFSKVLDHFVTENKRSKKIEYN